MNEKLDENKYYTYLLKHIPTGKVYYGCRYAKKSNPKDFWITYFTSSKIIKNLITETGKDSFIFEIRKTFKDPFECRKWEAKVLQKIDARNHHSFINKHNEDLNFFCLTHTEETKIKIGKSLLGKTHSEETKQKMRKPKPDGFGNIISKKLSGVPKSEEHKKKLSLSKLGIKNPKNSIKLKGRIPWNKGAKGLQIAWNKGRKSGIS